ncbi:hypothetical protein BC829DRAFT_490832 [Chytridium lagenaria]|nr:hypothetical protein BC829DRAFT_490832 [Chytridium lagenaria]
MRSWATFAVLASLLLQQHQISAFVPEDGKIWLGAWYQRPQGDKPTLLNSRLSRNLSFFQTDFNINMEIGLDDPTSEITPQALDQIDETGTNAIVYWTIYPKGGLDEVTDAQINDVADRIKQAVDRGHRVLIRYAPEMNATRELVSHWRRVYPMIKARVGTAGAEISTSFGLPTQATDQFSDPYTIYYPVTIMFDWTTAVVAWRQNVPPGPGQFFAQMSGNALPPQEWRDQVPTGVSMISYGMFSGDGIGAAGLRRNWTIPNVSKGWNPTGLNFPASETLLSPVHIPATRLEVKRGWWNEFLTTLWSTPNFKAVCSFEFSKSEEDTLRAFALVEDLATEATLSGRVLDKSAITSTSAATTARHYALYSAHLLLRRLRVHKKMLRSFPGQSALGVLEMALFLP